jgi:MFS family permease
MKQTNGQKKRDEAVRGALSWPFLQLYGLTLLYFTANAILNVIIPLNGRAMGATNTTVGIVMGAYLFTTMLLRPWAGQIIHKHGPIKVLHIILVVNGFALLLYPFTGLGGHFAARMLQGVCTAFFSMALQTGIMDALPDKERSQGISMYSLCASMPGIIGPLLAVSIWQPGEKGIFAAVMIAIAILTGAVGYTVKLGHREAGPVSGQAAKGVGMMSSFGQLFQNKPLFKCSALMLTASIVFGAVTTFVPLYAVEVEGGSAAVYLMLQAGVVVAARFVLRKRIPSDGKWHGVYVTGSILSLVLAALAISFSAAGGAVIFYAGAILMGICQAVLYPMFMTYLSFVLPRENRNVLIGLFIATADLGVSMGGVIMGPVADSFSYSAMYACCGGLGVLMLLMTYEQRGKLAGLR